MKQLIAVFAIFLCFGVGRSQTPPEFPVPFNIRLTDSVACTPVKDQNQSPTCWVFGTNSLFESDLIRKSGLHLNLSEMFIARYAYIDKANRWLETRGKTYFAGGGQFHDVIRVVNKYGIVPEEAYSGLISGARAHDHTALDSAMKSCMEKKLEQGKTALSAGDKRQLNDILDLYLGKVPKSFVYKNKHYTPQSFAKEVIPFANDYIEVVSFDNHAYYKQFVLEDKYNWASDSFYNITVDDMLMIVDTALANGWSVGWEGDVTDPGFNSFGGHASTVSPPAGYNDERIANYQSEETERDHMLHVVGAGKDENDRKWYYMKNSWGTWFNRYKGYLYMNENYFRMKTVILMVNKAALPAKLKARLGAPSLNIRTLNH